MKHILMLGAVLLCSLCASAQTNSYTVSGIVNTARDSRLINPWGLSRPYKSTLADNEWWTSDHGTGLSTLYDVNGAIVKLAVTIPPASGTGLGSPTGTAFDPYNNNFAFATLDGTISIWNSTALPSSPGTACAECHTTSANIVINHGASGASYQGVTIAQNATSGRATIYAANANGGVEVYDGTTFSPVTLPAGAFADSTIPSTYTPANIQAFGTIVVVTYNATAGGGTGFVDIFDTNGALKLRLAQGFFDQPWGLALTPANFGAFSNMLLVGNTGDGLIGAYKTSNGAFQGFLKNAAGQHIALPGLWGLEFGNGNVQAGPTNVLYFNTGGVSQTTGLFGAITAN
jgi:uncharacterized protein (TIGR03118 family)